MTTIHDFTAATITGGEQSLAEFNDQVLLVVNTASKCGFTPQYAGLQQLQDRFGPSDFTVLGFPCDQFAHQEPGDNDEIAQFCAVNYGVTFPMFAKIHVNGADAHPMYVWLRSQQRGMLSGRVKWNFTKFLVGRDGKVIARYGPATKPDKLVDAISQAIGTSPPTP